MGRWIAVLVDMHISYSDSVGTTRLSPAGVGAWCVVRGQGTAYVSAASR